MEVEPMEIEADNQTTHLSPLPMESVRYNLARPMKFVKSEKVRVKGLTYGLLTMELENYFRDIVTTCLDTSKDQNLAFQSLQCDPNMSLLVSHFSSFISSETVELAVNPNLRNLGCVMKMLHCILRNEHIDNMSIFLHEMLPAVMTCIVCSTISRYPEQEKDWKLRDYATEILKMICDKYSNSVNNIENRVKAVFRKALRNPELDFSSVYGSLRALKSLGNVGIDVDLEKIHSRIDNYLSRSYSNSAVKHRQNALRIRELLKAGISNRDVVTPKISTNKWPLQELQIPKWQESQSYPSGPWQMAAPTSVAYRPLLSIPGFSVRMAPVSLDQRQPVPVPTWTTQKSTEFPAANNPAVMIFDGDGDSSKNQEMSGQVANFPSDSNTNKTPATAGKHCPQERPMIENNSDVVSNARHNNTEQSVSTSPATCYTLQQVSINGVSQFLLHPTTISVKIGGRSQLSGSSIRSTSTDDNPRILRPQSLQSGNNTSTEAIPQVLPSASRLLPLSPTPSRSLRSASSTSTDDSPRILPSRSLRSGNSTSTDVSPRTLPSASRLPPSPSQSPPSQSLRRASSPSTDVSPRILPSRSRSLRSGSNTSTEVSPLMLPSKSLRSGTGTTFSPRILLSHSVRGRRSTGTEASSASPRIQPSRSLRSNSSTSTDSDAGIASTLPPRSVRRGRKGTTDVSPKW